MMNAVGIDIGGTKISLVLGTEKGKVLLRDEIPTRTGPQARRCVQELTARLKLLLRQSGVSRKKILGIGIGCPGAVNSVKGTVPRSPNLPGWTGIPLRKILSRSAGLPVFLANDANAAAMGESLFGAGCGVRDFIYITVSTGVGGGIVLGGRLHEGAGFAAGEIGHMSVVPDGQKCNCGKRGCLEAYASGTAIARFARKRTGRR
nr:ROK family protein [Candidatus Omnitrophota bacterium]